MPEKIVAQRIAADAASLPKMQMQLVILHLIIFQIPKKKSNISKTITYKFIKNKIVQIKIFLGSITSAGAAFKAGQEMDRK